MYALVVAAGSIGQVVGAPVTGLMMKRLPYIVTLVISSVVFAAGGVVYALSTNGWMLFAGRFLHGIASTMGAVLENTYIGDMGTKVDNIRKKLNKRTLKDILYVVYSFQISFNMFIAFGKS